MKREWSWMTPSLWLGNRKDGDVINRDVKTVGRVGFWEELRNSFPDWLSF